MTDHLDNDKEELRLTVRGFGNVTAELHQKFKSNDGREKLDWETFDGRCKYEETELLKAIDQYTQSKLKAFAGEVEEAIGKRKKFNFDGKTSVGMMSEEAYVNGQNNIINSVSKALKAIKEKYEL